MPIVVSDPTGIGLALADAKDALNIDQSNVSHDAEIQRYIAAAEAHIRRVAGDVVSAGRSVVVTASGGVLLLPVWPVQSVESISRGGSSYVTADLSVSAGGAVALASGGSLGGQWTVTYTAGWTDVADLYLAAVEDIRGLYQSSQVGAPSALGAFSEGGPGALTPVGQWPRIDAWAARAIPAIA